MVDHCCSRLAFDLNQKCDQHASRFECPDALIAEVRGVYGMIVHDGGNSLIEISFCPWCGAKLPNIADIEPDADEVEAP